MSTRKITRREFLQVGAMTAAGAALVACQPQTVIVEREKEIEVTKIVEVEKEIEKTVVVEKEKIVEKELVVTATPEPPSQYGESPQWGGMVTAQELPPVDERLPSEPLIIVPHEEIGQYGGTWHRLGTSVGDTKIDSKMTYEWMVRYNVAGSAIIPNIATSWESNPEGTVFTFSLRKGMKWSDGAPYTADDLLFKYEDHWLNEELSNIPVDFKSAGEPVVIEKLDDHTVRFTFTQPYGLFMRTVAGMRGRHLVDTPAAYMKQFHPKYADKAALDALIKEGGYEFWYQLYTSMDDPRDNRELPVLHAWVLSVDTTKQPLVFERNPYYWKVDTDGNQLPYVDKLEWMLVQGQEQVNLRAIQGEVDMQLRHIQFGNYPLFQESKEQGDYRTILWTAGEYETMIGINHTNQDPVLREIVQDKRFRYACSLGINRAEIIEAAYLGLTEPNQVSPLKTSPFYWEPQAKDKIEYDPEQANAYLDEMGLTDRDGDGFRLRPDGERLTLVYEYAPVFGAWGLIGELLVQYWGDLGIELKVKEVARQLLGEREDANELDVTVWTGAAEFDPLIEPRPFMPGTWQGSWGHQYAVWWSTDGAEGEEPTGDVLKLFEIWEQIKLTVDEQEQIDLFRQMLEINKENLFHIGLSTPPPVLLICKNDLRNVPEEALFSSHCRGPGNTATEQYFWRA